jgi:hypothetical protein
VWPVVADFFLTILAVFVFIEARTGRLAPELRRQLNVIDQAIRPLIAAKKVKEARIEYPESRVVLSDEYLAFPQCGWILTADKVAEVQRVLDLFLPVAPYISALNIEGHADTRRPTGCDGLAFRTNFELSQRRALAVYAGLLHVTMDKVEDLDEVTSRNRTEEGVVWQLRQRHRVLVAGYGDTRPWPNTPDPTSDAHRRVEVRFTFCRQRTDPECVLESSASNKSAPVTSSGPVATRGDRLPQRIQPHSAATDDRSAPRPALR